MTKGKAGNSSMNSTKSNKAKESSNRTKDKNDDDCLGVDERWWKNPLHDDFKEWSLAMLRQMQQMTHFPNTVSAMQDELSNLYGKEILTGQTVMGRLELHRPPFASASVTEPRTSGEGGIAKKVNGEKFLSRPATSSSSSSSDSDDSSDSSSSSSDDSSSMRSSTNKKSSGMMATNDSDKDSDDNDSDDSSDDDDESNSLKETHNEGVPECDASTSSSSSSSENDDSEDEDGLEGKAKQDADAAAGKLQIQGSDSDSSPNSSDDSDDDDDDDESSHVITNKAKPCPEADAAAGKSVALSNLNNVDSDDSESEDDEVNEESDDSEDDDSEEDDDEEDDEDEDEPEKKTEAYKRKHTEIKSSSSESDDDDDDESEEPDQKRKKVETVPPSKKAEETKSEIVTPDDSSSDDEVSDVDVSDVSSVDVSSCSSSSSSDDSDDDNSSESSESESEEEEEEAVLERNRKKTEEVARRLKEANEAAMKWQPSKSKPKVEVEAHRGTDGAQAMARGKPFTRVDNDYWGHVAVKDGGAMANNSYEGTFGDDGFGARSSAKLVTVRGKDFRHEKTKRKRSFNGFARTGGNISMQSFSTKYTYSDDE